MKMILAMTIALFFLILAANIQNNAVEKVLPSSTFELNKQSEVLTAQLGSRCSDYSWSQPLSGSGRGNSPIEAHQACIKLLNTESKNLLSMCINFCNGAGCMADIKSEYMCPTPVEEPFISHGHGTFKCTCK